LSRNIFRQPYLFDQIEDNLTIVVNGRRPPEERGGEKKNNNKFRGHCVSLYGFLSFQSAGADPLLQLSWPCFGVSCCPGGKLSCKDGREDYQEEGTT
jgi:hypothetical protein